MMKAETLRIIGSTIFWVFFVSVLLAEIIICSTKYSVLWFVILRQIFIGFELFGISIEIASWRIAKKKRNE